MGFDGGNWLVANICWMVEKSALQISTYGLFWERVVKPLTVWNSYSFGLGVFFSMTAGAGWIGRPVENMLSKVLSLLVLVEALVAYGRLGCLRVVKRFCIVLKSSKDDVLVYTFTYCLVY